MPDGTLRIVDYKTGKSSQHRKSAKKAPFDGGRQLQAALYAGVLQALLQRKVSRFEYRFPTDRGESEIVAYDAVELRAALGIVRQLLDQLGSGAFIPTTDHADCAFCDSSAICRVHYDAKSYKTTSPRATWAATHSPNLPVYELMRSLRAVQGRGGDDT